MLSDQELSELKDRCNYAAAHGFQIALADHYVTDLEDEAGEADYDGDKGTAAHLLVLIDMVEKGRAGASKKRAAKAAVPPPPPPPPPVPTTPPPPPVPPPSEPVEDAKDVKEEKSTKDVKVTKEEKDVKEGKHSKDVKDEKHSKKGKKD